MIICLLYTSDAADERSSVDLGGRRIIKKMDKNIVRDALAKAEQETKKNDISDQNKYLIDQKIEVLKNLTLN